MASSLKILSAFCALLNLLILVPTSKSAKCSTSVMSTATPTISYEQSSFTGSTTTKIYGAKVGSVSNSIYLMYELSSSSQTAIRKTYTNGTLIWMTGLTGTPLYKSLSVDAAEQSVYLCTTTSPITTIRLSAPTGSINSAYAIANLNYAFHNIKMHVLSDNSGFYVIGHYSISPNPPMMCKLLFSSASSAQCYTISNMYYYAFGQMMLTDSQFYLVTFKYSSPYVVYFSKVTFGSASTDWTSQMLCASGSCLASLSESLLSTDGSKIFSFFTYGSTNYYMYFASFNKTDGAVIGSRYKSSTPINRIYGSAQKGDLILLIVFDVLGNYYLAMLNTTANVFTMKQFSGAGLFGAAVQPNDAGFTVTGTLSNNGYITKFISSMMDSLTNFTFATWIMNVLAAGTEDITSTTSLALVLSMQTVSNPAYTNQTLAYNQVSSSNSDTSINTNIQTYSLVEKYYSTESPDLTCSLSGSTAIYYTLTCIDGLSAPNWITIDLFSGVLNISAPEVSSDNMTSIYINSTIAGSLYPIKKQIDIKVINCNVSYCQLCSRTSINSCITCASGYELSDSNSTCVLPNSPEVSESARAMTTTTQWITVSIIIIAGGASLENTYSLCSLWSMVNQIQILFLLLLTRANIPLDVKAVITGLKLLYNPSDMIPFKNIGIYKSILGVFYFDLSNPTFEPLELKSDSSVYNSSSFFVSVALFLICHCILQILNCLLKKLETRSNCRCYTSTCLWVLNKVLLIMTYGYYIRFILQTNQFLLISSMHEIYTLDTSSTPKILSLIFAFFVLFACFSLVGIVMYLSLSSYEVKEGQHNKIGEFYSGVRMKIKAKLYVTFLIIRRTLFVIVLICLASFPSKSMICILIFIQMTYFIYIVIARPFSEVKSNIIEFINELFFLFLLGVLTFINKEEDWTSSKTSTYSLTITLNSMTVLVIITVDGLKVLITRIYKRCSRPTMVSNLYLES